MRASPWTVHAILLLVCLVLASATVMAAPPELEIDLGEDGQPTLSGATDLVREADHTPGERYNWTLGLEANHTVVQVEAHGAFELARARQLVPLVDGFHFVELDDRDVADVDQPARVFNLEGGPENLTYRLGLPGPGTANLTLHLDTEPPGFSLGEPTNVTHRSFFLRTTTDEPALATLHVREQGQPEVQPRPTPSPSVEQRFPVVGLDPETTYLVNVTFEDWSGNTVTSEDLALETTPEPDRPKPELTVISPPPNATVLPEGVVIEVDLRSPASPVRAGDVHLFFDKERVPADELTFEEGKIIYEPEGPLDARPYSVSVEATNDAGGTGVARWAFTVQEAETPSTIPGVAGLLSVVVVSLIAAGLARRRQP